MKPSVPPGLTSVPPSRWREKSRGFSLVETLIATTIMAIAVTAILGLFVNMMKSYKYNAFRLSINRDVRTFTNELTDTATYSNYFVVLADFSTRTTGPTGSEVLASMAEGESGDCVLLVFKDPANDTKIQRMIGYYHDPDADGFGPIRKFDLTFSPTSSTTNIWTLMPAVSTLHTNDDIISAGTVGKATGTTSSGKLFYNFFNRSVMIKGQINYISSDGLTRRAVSTYNFTVSPRG